MAFVGRMLAGVETGFALLREGQGEENGAAINVNITSGTARLTAGESYGIVPYRAEQWSEVSTVNSAIALSDSNGKDGISLTITANAAVATTGSNLHPLFADSAQDHRVIEGETTWSYNKNAVVLEFSGIPYEKYDVYLYMASEGDTTSQYWGNRNKNGPVFLNGDMTRHYRATTGQANAVVSLGDGLTWGSSRAWTTPEIGSNVMCIQDLSGSTLKLSTFQRNEANTRGSVAAVQIVSRVDPNAPIPSYVRMPGVKLTGKSINFALGACDGKGVALSGKNLYGVAPYQVPGWGWNNLEPTSSSGGSSFTHTSVVDNTGATVDGATFAVNTHGEVASATVDDATASADDIVTSDYCLLPAGASKMAFFRENNDSTGKDTFVFSGVPYKKFAVVLYIGQGAYTADGHDYVTVSQTLPHGTNSSRTSETYQTKYTYKDGKLTIIDGEVNADGTSFIGLWGEPTTNWSNQEGDGVMVLPNQMADAEGNYTFRVSQLNNKGAGASKRSQFRAVSFVELEEEVHEPLDSARDSFGFVMGKVTNSSSTVGVESLPEDVAYGLDGYAIEGKGWNPLSWTSASESGCTVTAVKNRSGSVLSGTTFKLTHEASGDYAPVALGRDAQPSNPRVLAPFPDDVAFTQRNVSLELTGVPYAKYTAILYLGKDEAWYTGKKCSAVTVVADGVTTSYTYVDGKLTKGTGDWFTYDQAGIVGREGMGVMVIRGLTARDISFTTTGGTYNSQFQALQIVQETSRDAQLYSGTTMLHRFDFEETMIDGSYTRIAPIDKGANGRAFPVTTASSSFDFIAGDEGKFGNGSLRVCKNMGGISSNSDGFKLRNQSGLGCSVHQGFTLSFFMNVRAENVGWRGALSFAFGHPGTPDSKTFSLRVEQKGKGSGKLTFYPSEGTLEKSDNVTGSYTIGEWAHIACVVRPVASTDTDLSTTSGVMDLYVNGTKCGTYGLPVSTDKIWNEELILKELLIGRTRRTSSQQTSDTNSSSGYYDPNPIYTDLDEVALFDRPISEEGIAWLATHEAAVPPSEVATPYWQAIPANHTGATNGNYSSFKVCLGADGLARVGDAVPVTLPEEVKLHAMTVAWRGDGTTTNHKIRRVALVDSEGRVAAVSWNTQDVPLGTSGTVMSTVFTFPEGTAVDTTQTYTGYFVDSAPLAVDEIFDTSRAITGSMGAFTGASEEGGFYLPELTTASPMMSFTLSTAEESVWQATLTGDVSAEDLEVVSSKGTTTKKFTELTDSDAVELTVETARATLTLTDAKTLDSITVKGSGTLAITGGKLTATQGVAVSLQSTLELREDTDWKITGPGKVVIPAGVEASLTCTENAYTGGTVVLGTLRWAGEGTLGTGEVVVQSGGVFDIGELACAQAITLAGGKLAGAFEREDSVFSVNFNSSQGAVGATEVAGLLPMLGEYWTQSAQKPADNTALTLVSESAMGTTGATTTSVANALSVNVSTLWSGSNNTSFLKGYLDDSGTSGAFTVSLTLPEEIASRGYDLYLYSNTDTANVPFTAREIVADGVSTSYTYVDGVLTTGSTAGWGNSNSGRTTVAEGVNVMVIPDLTSQANTINLWHNGSNRGCLAALQGRVHNGGAYTVAYTGALKVTKPSQVEAASGKGIYLAGTTITGSGTLEAVGSGQVVASGVDFGERELGVSSGEVLFESGNTLDGVVVNVASGARAAVGDSVSSLTISGLKGEGVFDAGKATEIILTGGVGSGATFKGELASSAEGEAQTLIKRGAAKQVFASLAGFTASISVEGGTLEYDPASAQTVARLLLNGGAFSTQGVGAVSAAFTQMTAGNVTMAPAGTAQSARPAMETASAATVSNFTLATGGTVLYYSEADFAKYFPAGFIPQGDYTVRLSSDFADTLSFPYTFTILGAASGARFTVLDANGNEAPEGSWSASGGRITLNKEDAIVGDQGTLPAPRYHYTFDNENCNAADDAQVKTALSGGSPYVDSDNGKALHGGTPWISAALSGEWTAGLYVRLDDMPAYSILFAIGRTNVSGALLLVRGEGNTLVLLRNVSGTLTEVCRATLPGNGQTWSHLALLHTVTAYRLYVNGELVATASGEFTETQEGFQIGTFFGKDTPGWDGRTPTNWSASPASVDDCAVYNVALRGKLLKQAAGKLMARRRWHDAVLPADLFDPTATDWRDVEGATGTWPGTGNAPETTTAEVELGGDATWEDTLAAITEKGFATRQAILSGASLTCTLSSLSTPVALPTGVASLTASNAVTLDLANVQAQVAARVLGGVEEVKVMEGFFTGDVSLANAPSGSAFSALSAEARDDGIWLTWTSATTYNVYTRTISGDGAWSEAGAWSLADGSVAPEAEPPAGAKVVLSMEGDATLTVSHADLKPDEILLFGSGDLTLRFDGSWLTDDFYGAIPRAGTTITLLDATHDTDRVKVWLDPLKYGAQAVMTRSGTQAQVTITLPEACYAAGSDVPDLSLGKVVRAEVLGNATWENLTWTDGNGVATTAPTATDIAEIVLKADATLSATAATCATLRVYGEGHAVALSPRANFTVGTYAFFNDATLALEEAEGEQETLPTNCSILPKRVRYDYAYEGNLSTTAKYETEFATGFSGAVTPAGGLVEFSGGTVTFSSVPNSGTSTAYVFSGDVQAVDNSGRFSVGAAQVYLRGNAQVSSDRLVLSDGGGGRASQMEIAGDATFTVTGSNNSGSNLNSLLIGHWTGTASITLRERGKLVAEQAEAALAHDATKTSVTIEDDAEMRVAGLAINRAGKDVSLVLNGGRLLVGKLGLVSHTGQVSRLIFNGGAIGAWQDVSLGSSVATLFSSVSGTPRFSSSGATLTLTTMDLFQDVGAGKVELLQGGLTLQGTSFTAFSHLALTNGTLTLAECSPMLDVLTLSGGTLGLEGAFPTVGVLRVPGNVEVRIPLEERLSDGGCLALTSGTALPDLSRAVFTLVLDPDRDESSRVIPEVPLVLGTYAEGAEAKIKGFALANNTNNAVSDYSAVLKVGTSGQGLYAELKGAEVLSEHTVSLTETAEGSGYTLIQSTVDAYPYHIFSGEASGARLLVPEGGVILPYAAFKGNAIRIVAGGSVPHTLLQGTGFTFSTDVTFDLGAWADKMPEFVRGAARGVPASICLVSGGVALVPSTVRLSVAFGSDTAPTYTLPDGFTESIEVTADGVYYVVQSDRRVRTVSVDFTEDAYPLVAPPASIGAYALPAGAWNVLSGTAYAPRLQVSDLGGGLEGEAQDASGTVTQLQASSVLTEQDSSAPTALLKVWLDDTAAQRVRILNVPFEAYRVALVFAGGVSGAQYAVATVNGSTYAMDGEGYTRRDITSHKTSSSGVRVAGDTMWGTTETPDADAPVVLGENALVTDVLTDSTAEITLPVSSYGVYNAGLAAIQILEAPEATAIAEAQSFSYTFTASGAYKLEDLVLEGSGTAWKNGSGNALTLICDVDATLTLPAGFEADRVVVRGSGWLTLNVADNGGAALNILNAAQMANLTTDFPCAGVTFVPAEQVSRFEQIFDNNGLSYVISSGATLALGENSGITTNFDDVSSPILSINTESLGTLRRDYTVVQTSMLSYPKLTFAFRDGTNTQTTDNSNYNILVEAGDTINYIGKYHLQTTADTWSYTQTGGSLSCTSTADSNYGFLLFNNTSSASTAILTLTGGRMELSALRVHKTGCTADMSVSGDAVLALGVGGLIPVNASDTLSLSFSEEGTLEATTATLGRGGSGTLSVVFNGGCLATAMPQSTFSMPLTFSGSESEPTKIRAGVSTIVLSGTNSGSGHIAVESGTLAIANVAALGNAQVAVNAGTTFEVRELGAETISGAVTFADGSTCSVTTASDVTLPYTASIAGSVTFSGEQSAVTFLLNGEIYDGSKVTVDGGKVTFTSEAKVTFDAVEWGTDQASGIWQDGVAGPWKDGKTFHNGASVTFGANTVDAVNNSVKVSLQGRVAPASLAVTGTDRYTFLQGTEGAYLDASALGTALAMGSGQIYDVPIGIASPAGVTVSGGYNSFRLLGMLSNDGKTASLLGSNNDVTASDVHGVWRGADYTGDITLAPHAGETQILPAYGTQLAGGGNVTITGGGTVQFAGSNGNNYNGNFSGTIIVQNSTTLDFAMARTWSGDENPYFCTDSSRATPTTKIVLKNGGTVRFSGCRGVLGGWYQRTNSAFVQEQLLTLGKDCRVEYAYVTGGTNGQQYMPYSILLNGSGATLCAKDGAGTSQQEGVRGMYLARGATITVAGIGDAGDPADEKTVDGKLTEGITAFIEADEGTGLVRWSEGLGSTSDTGVTFNVGEGSNLRILADITSPAKSSNANTTIFKTGNGRLSIEFASISVRVPVKVDAGTLGGSSALVHEDSVITLAAGTTIEAGLRVPKLFLAKNITLALDPTGSRLLRADRAIFTAGGAYTITSLVDSDEIPEAGEAPVKVMAWSSEQNVGTVTFTLDSAITAKGYGLEVGEDGLYLKRHITYIKELNFEVDDGNPPTTVYVAWFRDATWYRLDDTEKTLRNYDPDDNEAVTACFVLPEAYAGSSVLSTPAFYITLTQEAAFSNVSFAVWEEDTTSGEKVLKPLSANVVYTYDLTKETMPGEDEVLTFTWVPTLAVDLASGSTTSAQLKANVPSGYACMVRDATAVVYQAASQVALNLNFTDRVSGDVAWISAEEVGGAVPFAGVYWNNISTANGGGQVTDGYSHYEGSGVVAGMTSDDGEAVSCAVHLACKAVSTITSRRGSGDAALSVSHIKGSRTQIPEAIRTEGGMTASGTSSGWQVRVESVPFEMYDLYILLAGDEDGTVTYPAVRIKAGSWDDWRTFSLVNGWTAPASTGETWSGTGSLVNGGFVAGRNLLHLRISATKGSDLQIVPCDGGQDSDDLAAAVGLAALQIVQCEDGVELERLGTGKWSDASGWKRTTLSGEETLKWSDATTSEPWSAKIPTTSLLTLDTNASTPFLAFTGSTTMRLARSSGAISTSPGSLFGDGAHRAG